MTERFPLVSKKVRDLQKMFHFLIMVKRNVYTLLFEGSIHLNFKTHYINRCVKTNSAFLIDCNRFFPNPLCSWVKKNNINTWMPEQNGCYFADDFLKWIFAKKIILIRILILITGVCSQWSDWPQVSRCQRCLSRLGLARLRHHKSALV